jgi:hypothetical protein
MVSTRYNPGDFERLYMAWLSKEPRDRDGDIPGLVAGYRQAWYSGSHGDRRMVLHFILLQTVSEGLDLVIEALRSDDQRLAEIASAAILNFVLNGHDIGPSARDALSEFSERFPESAIVAAEILAHLDGPPRTI